MIFSSWKTCFSELTPGSQTLTYIEGQRIRTFFHQTTKKPLAYYNKIINKIIKLVNALVFTELYYDHNCSVDNFIFLIYFLFTVKGKVWVPCSPASNVFNVLNFKAGRDELLERRRQVHESFVGRNSEFVSMQMNVIWFGGRKEFCWITTNIFLKYNLCVQVE